MLEWEGNSLLTLPPSTIFGIFSGFETAQQDTDAWIAVTCSEQKGLCAASNFQWI